MKAIIYAGMAVADPENKRPFLSRERATANRYTIVGEYSKAENGFANEPPVLSQTLRDELIHEATLICPDNSTHGQYAQLDSQRAVAICSIGTYLVLGSRG